MKDTCFTISNIAAGSQKQISAIIDAKIIPALVLLFNTSNEIEIKAEVTWALANALSNGNETHITYLIDQDCISCLCKFIEFYDIITIEAVLEALENVYKVGESLVKEKVKRNNIFLQHLQETSESQLLKLYHEVDDESIKLKISSIYSLLGKNIE